MTSAPRHPDGKDQFGIGMNADGTLNVVPPDELAQRTAERDADEATEPQIFDETDDSADKLDEELADVDEAE